MEMLLILNLMRHLTLLKSGDWNEPMTVKVRCSSRVSLKAGGVQRFI